VSRELVVQAEDDAEVAADSSGVANLTNLSEQEVRTERAQRARLAQLAEYSEKGSLPLPCRRLQPHQLALA